MSYHKIQTVFKRDPETKYKTLLEGEYSLPEFEYLADCQWAWTEKVDGTNIRVEWDGSKVTFGGRTDRAQIPAQLVAWLEDKFLAQVDTFVDVFGSDPATLYGEGYGAKIQKVGHLYSPQQKLVLFDVRCGDWWLERKDIRGVAAQLGVCIVPLVGQGTLPELVGYVRAGALSRWGDFLAEGVVARPTVELKARNGHRIITKLKCKDFPKEASREDS